ncbi:antibiotic biosynthesis monooxygenase [Nitratireductor aquimarinus]|uniref:antibiotic biosynthesis monooxygenase family protein n=1 Tax=Alphaproteobacteria TaxID=28211 RepID=UPI0019D3FC4D|nr:MULTISPECIES: antibiotic biosynthesis monooxygenase family protein [Alphaproteobacteria]MBN7757589.1 antibiotic biosynthesis monooxygenase [Nitratireductor aquimarinus]MBY6000350.1 antibiotic biosynthesis monooxygenase [Tritonibacter mobilis]MBY6022380.1 antibiotic biosynthesis monooxygenase [Nitratireductor sp. DP7N14-4]
MSTISTDAAFAPVYRVDKFAVPAAGRQEFLERVSATHDALRRQDGFVRDVVLEQASGPGDFNFVTLVEWRDEAAFAGASQAVASMHQETGFDRHEMMERLGIRADIANYRALPV